MTTYRELFLPKNPMNLVEEKAPNGVLPYGGYELEIELMQTPMWDPITSTWDRWTCESRSVSLKFPLTYSQPRVWAIDTPTLGGTTSFSPIHQAMCLGRLIIFWITLESTSSKP